MRASGIAFAFLFSMMIDPLLRAENTEAQQKTATEAKQAFVNAFRAADEVALNNSYDAIMKNNPQDPDLPDFGSELGKLYAHAAMLRPNEMKDEAIRADALLREFSPGGRYADKPAAGWKQIQHAEFLVNMGQETAARMIYRNLATYPQDAVFSRAVNKVISNTEMTPADVKFWADAIEKRLPNISKANGLKGDLSLLRLWDSEAMHARRLAIEARVHQKKADYLLSTGQIDQGLKEMKRIKDAADEYFSLIAAGKAPKEKPNSRGARYLKLSLAMAEAWLDNNRRAVEITNELLNTMHAAKEGEPSLVAHVKYWQLITQDRVKTVPADEMEKRLFDLLSEGECGPHLACRVVERLAQIAEKKGNKALAHAYFRDLANALPDPSAALWARKQQQALENEQPELKQQIAADPTGMAFLFAKENDEATSQHDAALAAGRLTGIRAFSNWREPQYKTRLDEKDEDGV